MSEKLLPCPFCGGESTRPFVEDDEFGRQSHGIQCANGDCWISGPEHETVAKAIAAWNRRAPAAPATPAPDMREVERLADCLTAIGIPREQQRHAAAAKLRALSAENLALREKLEAAEAEKDSAIKWRDHYRTSWLDSRDRLTPPADLSAALQRVRDEAWNEAIEEASVIAETTPDDLVGTMELTPSQYAVAARIRALRRAPTEGEG